MKYLTIIVFILSSSLLIAQSPNDSLTMFFDDLSDDLVLDTIYPPGCWQIGTPSKTVFTSAYSPGGALVTDTVQPYADSTTCYAEFTLVSTDPSYWGRSILFWQKRDMDTSSRAFVEVEDPWVGGWRRYGTEWDEWAWVDGNGLPNDGSGIEWTGQSAGWEEIWLESPCIGVIWDPNSPDWFTDTMRLRFVFEANGNPDGHDGWMIDNVRAGVSLCTGNIQEKDIGTMSVYPNPAYTTATIELAGTGNSQYQVYRADGVLIGQGTLQNPAHNLDVSSWSQGLYFVRAVGDDQEVWGRVSVVR